MGKSPERSAAQTQITKQGWQRALKSGAVLAVSANLSPRAVWYTLQMERKYSLTDRGGPWCASCLGYIRHSESIECHHVVPQRFASDHALGKSLKRWTVPVHGKGCHRKDMDLLGSGIRRQLNGLVRLAKNCQSADLETYNVALYESGSHSLSVIFRSVQLDAAVEGSSRQTQLNFLLASSAALSWLRADEPLREWSSDDSRVVIRRATQHLSWGERVLASKLFAEVQGRPGVGKSESMRGLLMRTALGITGDERSIDATLRESWGSPYTRSTSFMLGAATHCAHRAFSSALDLVDELERLPQPSGYYLAATAYYRGAASLFGERDIEAAYIHFCRSQYMLAMLGLRLGQHLVRVPGLRVLDPTDALDMPWVEALSESDRTSLRREAIGYAEQHGTVANRVSCMLNPQALHERNYTVPTLPPTQEGKKGSE